MFHRIKSEPQAPVSKEENKDNAEIEEVVAAADDEGGEQDEVSAAQEDDDTLSPVQRYAKQQESELSQDESEEESAQDLDDESDETAAENENELQEEKETEPMINAAEDNVEEQTQEEESAYRAPAAPAAGGYPGSYAGSGYTAPGAPAATADIPTARDVAASQSSSSAVSPENGGRLVIGSGITMSGEIEACPHLIVEGTVEASLRGAEILEVSQGGVFFGTVEIDEATISGRFEGDITVTGRLTVTSTGQITGSITYGELEMESGAHVDGKLTPISAASASKGKAPAKKASAGKAQANAAAPASNDAQLFDQEAA